MRTNRKDWQNGYELGARIKRPETAIIICAPSISADCTSTDPPDRSTLQLPGPIGNSSLLT